MSRPRTQSSRVAPQRILHSLVALSLLSLACGGPASGAGPISGPELVARIEARQAPLILDVRSPDEYAGGHIPGAVNIPYDALPERLAALPADRDAEIVVHCQSGRRAGIAEGVLLEAGYTQVRDLTGHWQAWDAAGLPQE